MLDAHDDVASVLRPLLLTCAPFGVGLLDADAGLPFRLLRSAASLLVAGVSVTQVALYLRLTLSPNNLYGHIVARAVAILLTGVTSCVCTGVHLLDGGAGVAASFRRLPGRDLRSFRRRVVASLVLVLAYNAALVTWRLAETADVSFAAAIFQHAVSDLTVLQFTALVALLSDQHRRLNDDVVAPAVQRRLVDVRRRHSELTRLSGQVLRVFGPAVVATVVKVTLSVVAVVFEVIARFAKRKKPSSSKYSTVVTVAVFVQIVVSLVRLLCLTSSCHQLTAESSRTATLAVEQLLSLDNEAEEAQELEDLARQVQSVAAPKVAAGVVTLDGKLLVGAVSTAATYVVILLQFALEEESH